MGSGLLTRSANRTSVSGIQAGTSYGKARRYACIPRTPCRQSARASFSPSEGARLDPPWIYHDAGGGTGHQLSPNHTAATDNVPQAIVSSKWHVASEAKHCIDFTADNDKRSACAVGASLTADLRRRFVTILVRVRLANEMRISSPIMPQRIIPLSVTDASSFT